MPSPNIHVTTSVDTSGLRPLEEALQRYKALSDAIAQNFSAFRPPTNPSPGAPAATQPIPMAVGETRQAGPIFSDPNAATHAPAASDLIPHLDRLAAALERIPTSAGMGTTPPGGTTGGAGYNLNSISGLENWVQNVMAPATPVIDAMEAAGQGPVGSSTTASAPSGHSATVAAAQQRVQRAHQQAQQAVQAGIPSGSMIGPSGVSKTAFDALYRLATEPGYVPETDPMFQAAQNATGWSAGQVHQVAGTIAEQAVSGATPAQIRTTLNGGGGSRMPPGSPPSSGPGGFGAEAAGAVGGLASHYLPFLGLAGAAMFGAGQLEGGWTNFSQQAGPMSDLIKQVGSANSSLEAFRMALDSGSAALGITMPQVTAIATTLVPILGALSTSALAQAVTGVSSFAQGFGVPVTQATQIFSTAAQLGLTSGVGAPFTENSFSGLLGSMGPAADMTGRTGPLATGYLSAMQSVEQQGGNVVPTGSKGVANILAWMGSSGMQGLQGTRGAQVFSSLNDAYVNAANGNTPGAGLVMAALQKADPRLAANPVQLLSVLGQGLGATLPGTHTTAFEAVMQQIQASFGSTPQDIALGMTSTLGTPINTGLSIAELHASTGVWSTPANAANTYEKAHHLHLTSGGQQLLGQALNDSSLAQVHATITRFLHNGGQMTPAMTQALAAHDLPALRLAFAHAEEAQHYTGLTGFQKFQSTEAEIGQGISHLISPTLAAVGGSVSGTLGHMNPYAVGGLDLATLGGAATGLWMASKYVPKTIKGLLTKLRGGSSAEVQAVDQAAQAAGETSTLAGSEAVSGGANVMADTGSGALQIAGDMASRLPLIGTGVSMLMDVPHMLSQMQHGQAGKGIGGMVGTGAGAWGGAVAGATIAGPLDPFTFGLASLVGGGIGAFAGSTLGRHLGSWLGGAVTGEKSATQYGTMQIQQLEVGQLWIQSMVGATHGLGPHSLTHTGTLGSSHHPAPSSAGGLSGLFGEAWRALVGSSSPSRSTTNAVSGVNSGGQYGMPPNIPLGPHAITQAAQLQSMGFMQRVKALVPYAQLESHKTGLPVNLLLAQWMDESSLGTSPLAQSQNNLAGVGFNGKTYDRFANLKAFTQGQTAFYEDNPRYDALLTAAKHGASIPTLLKDLQSSGYAQAPNYGSAIQALLSSIDASLKAIRHQQKAHPLSLGPAPHVNTGIPKRKG